MRVSAVLITFNEEANIVAALKSLTGIADEIVVVDSGSTDRTVKLARAFTDKVVTRKWTNYSDQKNFANGLASHPWILSLDADERISDNLRTEILSLRGEDPACAGFAIPRLVFYLGRWIRHCGWYPDRKVRLFRKDAARWEGEFVHETLAVSGEIKRFKNPIHHFTYRNIADHLARIDRFADLGAQKLYARGRKCHWYLLFFLPLGRFLKSYFLKRGFLDGYAGIVVSVLNGYSIFVRYAKLGEIWKKGARIEPFPD
ncbi:MAG: glycosyltransferase family 2 protein [Acidobacteriota bacterium]|nr:glycosyltransferase family 2 protein [Acidobacteriota bacterium]